MVECSDHDDHEGLCQLQLELSRFFVSRRKRCKDFSANTAQEKGDRRKRTSGFELGRWSFYSCRLSLEQCLQRSIYNYN